MFFEVSWFDVYCATRVCKQPLDKIVQARAARSLAQKVRRLPDDQVAHAKLIATDAVFDALRSREIDRGVRRHLMCVAKSLGLPVSQPC